MMTRIITSSLRDKGIHLNGNAPWEPQIHDERFYRETILKGSLGLGEAYMKEYWSCEALDEFFFRLLETPPKCASLHWYDYYFRLKHSLFNQQTPEKSKEVCSLHYDIDVNLFKKILDERLTYSCAHWSGEPKDLHQSQEQKLAFICDSLNLKPGLSLLDVGCGWGSLIRYAAEKHQVSCTGYSLAQNQVDYIQSTKKDLPIDARYSDYRSMQGTYDRIASIEMFEAVGQKNFDLFMRTLRDHISDSGAFFLQTITRSKKKSSGDRWVDQYIFPNGMLPTLDEVKKAAAPYWDVKEVVERGLDYDRTLMAWRQNLDRSTDLTLPPSERRKWEYYFSCFAGSFRAGHCQLYQLVFVPKSKSL